MTWLFDYVLERGGHNRTSGVVESDKKDQEEEEETPPPLPPRQRPEVTDEPVTKKSRANSHGMSQTKHSFKKETNKNKSKMGRLCDFMSRRGKRQKDDNAGRKSSKGTGRLGLLRYYYCVRPLLFHTSRRCHLGWKECHSPTGFWTFFRLKLIPRVCNLYHWFTTCQTKHQEFGWNIFLNYLHMKNPHMPKSHELRLFIISHIIHLSYPRLLTFLICSWHDRESKNRQFQEYKYTWSC